MVGLIYIGWSVNFGPLDQTNLKERRRCNLGGGGEPTFEGGADMAATYSALRWSAFWSLLESSHVGFAVDKRDLL